MTLNRWVATAALAGALRVALLAADATDEIKSLKEQIEQLDQKVRILERNRELESEAISSQKLRRDARPSGSSITNQTFGVIHNTVWQVSASYILTGEENSYRGFQPTRPLSFANGGWGAWEIAARIGELDVDNEVFPIFASSTSASKATSWGLGLNWHLNRNVKLNFNFENTDFEVAAVRANTVTGHDEKVIFSRIQVAF